MGTILLLDVDADQALLEHCTQLCESYDFMRLVKLEQADGMLRELLT